MTSIITIYSIMYMVFRFSANDSGCIELMESHAISECHFVGILTQCILKYGIFTDPHSTSYTVDSFDSILFSSFLQNPAKLSRQ